MYNTVMKLSILKNPQCTLGSSGFLSTLFSHNATGSFLRLVDGDAMVAAVMAEPEMLYKDEFNPNLSKQPFKMNYCVL